MDRETQAAAIMQLTVEYRDEEDKFYNLLEKSQLDKEEQQEMIDLYLDSAWFGMYKQRLLEILERGVYKNE